MAVLDWRGGGYPQPRPGRGGKAGDISPVQVVNLPRTRLWSVQTLTTAANSSLTRVSPKLVGPALVKSMYLNYTLVGGGLGTAGGISLRWSVDGSGEGLSAGAVVFPTGVPLFDQDYQREPGGSTVRAEMFAQEPASQSERDSPILLDYIIQEPEFFLKFININNSALVNMQASALITIYENVDPNTMIDLLG